MPSNRPRTALGSALNNDSLDQLRKLKQELHEQTERVEGVVRGTRGRFGFVAVSRKRDIFLPPEQMQRVLPGDTVRVAVVKDDNGKPYGEIEALLDSPLDEFMGRYVVRGQGHFAEPDLPGFGRLLFIPPSQRKKAQPGDFIRCKVTRHPFKDGKSQVDVLECIGSDSDPGVEARYIVRKFNLDRQWSEQELQGITDDRFSADRVDLLEVPFVTIDAAEAKDVDDALFAESTDYGWRLLVAIAEPAAHIEPGSELEKAVARRGITTYLPGHVIPMLPEEISHDRCSLLPELDRPAMVCEIHLDPEARVIEYGFKQALIRSYAKLRYRDVSAHLQRETKLPHPELTVLHELACALRERRKEHHVMMEERPDFRLILNDEKRIDTIFKIERNDAHRLVEECMIVANRCAADWLKDDAALFVAHIGIREDRLKPLKKLMRSQMEDWADKDPRQLPNYIGLMHALEQADCELPLRSIVTRMLERSELVTSPRPHHGLGFETYTTFTSPLRKYSDYLTQSCLRAKLTGKPAPQFAESLLQELRGAIDERRNAAQQLEQWLKCEYMQNRVGEEFTASILHMSGGGFTVMLEENGIEGFVDARGIEGKLSFSPEQLTLSNKAQHFQLNQRVRVKLERVELGERMLYFQYLGHVAD